MFPKCFSRPTPATRRSFGGGARPGSAPPPPLRRFHSSRAPSSDCVSLLDEITGSLPTMDPSQPMPFPESNYTEEDSSDDVQLQQEPRRRKRGGHAGGGGGGSRAKGDSYRSDLVIYSSAQQPQQREANANDGGPAHLDSLTTATGFTSFGDDLTSFNTSVGADMPSLPRPKNHQAGSKLRNDNPFAVTFSQIKLNMRLKLLIISTLARPIISTAKEMEQEYLPQFVLPLSQTEGRDGLAANPERVFKVIFIGDSSVGKTSLIRRFCQGAFTPEVS